MRALALLALALAACAAPPPRALETPVPTLEPGVVSVTALLDLSGPGSAAGSQQREAIAAWLTRGRAGGKPLRVRFVDVAGSDARVLLELQRASVERPASAVVVGSAVAYGRVLGRAIDLAARPVLFLEPVAGDPAAGPGGRWAFALAPTLEQLAAATIDDATRRKAYSPSLVLLDSADRIEPFDRALGAEIRRRGLAPTTRSALGADGSPTAAARSAMPVLRGVICLARLEACRALARDARAALAPTYFYLPWTVTPAAVRDASELWPRALWPSFAVADPLMPSVHAATAFDAMTLLAAAARAGTEPGLRDGLEGINMRLIATSYSFDAWRHAGADPLDIALVGWTGSRVGPVPALPFP